METALQELLKYVNGMPNQQVYAEEINCIKERIKQLLSKEREQIEQEVLNAIKWVEDNFYSNGNDFFTHIDTQVQYKRAELYKHYETNSNTK